MGTRFEVGVIGGTAVKKYREWLPAEQDLKARVKARLPVGEGYELRPWGKSDNFGPKRTFEEAFDRIRDHVKGGQDGDGITIRQADRVGPPRFYAKRYWVFDTKGPLVVKHALSQLGVEYKWAWADPRGDDDGVSGFDCSGLSSWCYAQVGVRLPHSAHWTWHDWQVTNFYSSAGLRPGDLIFYFNPIQHIGIYAGEGMVIDASTYHDAVVRRDMHANPIYGYGYVEEVTGAR